MNDFIEFLNEHSYIKHNLNLSFDVGNRKIPNSFLNFHGNYYILL